MIGIGVDVVQNNRIRESLEKFGDRFISRIYTEGEQEYCNKCVDRAIHYAARFAAKEAAFKALGTGWAAGVRWRDVEIVRTSSGRPELRLHGVAQERAQSMGVARTHVSLTHDQLVSVATVVFDA